MLHWYTGIVCMHHLAAAGSSANKASSAGSGTARHHSLAALHGAHHETSVAVLDTCAVPEGESVQLASEAAQAAIDVLAAHEALEQAAIVRPWALQHGTGTLFVRVLATSASGTWQRAKLSSIRAWWISTPAVDAHYKSRL